ncbi:MAG: hypothetical protein QY318_00775 [Candidatus Dojkabacteria bacterium]|nr:MAG: hypothetical protein QY318_00775 [Candidatus Dojkabacteria bacterium]
MINSSSQKRLRTYSAQGFIEALIAILVAGIACVVLMLVASKTISQMNRNEIHDELTVSAIQGGEMMKFLVDGYVVHEPPSGLGNFLPLNFSANGTLLDAGKCVAISGGLTDAELTSKDTALCNYNLLQGGIIPSECLDTDEAIVNPDEQGDIFRVMCIHPESTERTLVVRFFTGFEPECRNEGGYQSVVGSNDQEASECIIYGYTSAYSTVQTIENE